MGIYIKGISIPEFGEKIIILTSSGYVEDVSGQVIDGVEAVSADMRPVRHGWWVKTIGENGVTSACRCNLCGFEDNRYSLFNYCPKCGAKMDKEKTE